MHKQITLQNHWPEDTSLLFGYAEHHPGQWPEDPHAPKNSTREFPCDNCDDGEFIQSGYTTSSGTTLYICNSCYRGVSFP